MLRRAPPRITHRIGKEYTAAQPRKPRRRFERGVEGWQHKFNDDDAAEEGSEVGEFAM